ncbi:MAG TPA: LysM peptidoglycan-binding domain-containing protein [Chthoniobacterales bacterium]|jgi:LysM repeat protein|nr:LysM peptidoglycan-binding domain-containing protein [Chthoniobacterales bacterium]
MRLPSLFPSKKLRATTARRGLGVPDEMDYEEMSEPNMKLSRALLIVLVLHVVAVAGIIAFNTIKSRQGIVPPPAAKTTASTSTQKLSAPAVTTADSTKSREETTKPVVKEERKAIPVKPILENTPKAEVAKKTYVVAKGDTPVSIAKKFKITSDQLLTANKIEDAHKLKIGQKLVIPAPKEKSVSKEKAAPKEKKKSKKSE